MRRFIATSFALAFLACANPNFKPAFDAAGAKVAACLADHAQEFITAVDPLAFVEKYVVDCGLADIEAGIAFFEALNHPQAKAQGAKARALLAARRAGAAK
jgi:hypothetical protein